MWIVRNALFLAKIKGWRAALRYVQCAWRVVI